MEAVLTSEERQELVTVLRELDPAAVPEKRGASRRKVMMNLWIRRMGQGLNRTLAKLVLINVSKTGVGILAKGAFAVGDKFVMPLHFEDGGGWLVLCEVANAKTLADGHFRVGAKFMEHIDDPHGDARIPGDWLAYER